MEMYTKQNLEAIEEAICDLHAGKRVTSVWYGDTRVQYAETSLQDLLNLRSRIKSGLDDSEKVRERQAIFITSKGLQ
jgi:hypothetical protein